jgi:hypothetical protein
MPSVKLLKLSGGNARNASGEQRCAASRDQRLRHTVYMAGGIRKNTDTAAGHGGP